MLLMHAKTILNEQIIPKNRNILNYLPLTRFSSSPTFLNTSFRVFSTIKACWNCFPTSFTVLDTTSFAESKIIEILCQIWITYTHPISMFFICNFFLLLSLNFAIRNGQSLTHHICLIRILLECMDFYKKNKNHIENIGKWIDLISI